MTWQEQKKDAPEEHQTKISKIHLNLVRDFLFKFSVIWEVWLPVLII